MHTNIVQHPEREFLLRVSYMEIYNESKCIIVIFAVLPVPYIFVVINDLLSPGMMNLRIHEDASRGIYVGGLKEEIVLSPEHVLSLIAAGEAQRHVGATNYNEQSSRSHTLFRYVLFSTLHG